MIWKRTQASEDELAECLRWAAAGIAVVVGVRDPELLASARRGPTAAAVIEGIVVDDWNCWTIVAADSAPGPSVQSRRRRTPRSGVAVVEFCINA